MSCLQESCAGCTPYEAVRRLIVDRFTREGHEVLADDRHARVLGRALGLAEAVEALAGELEDRVGPRAVVLLGERDVHLP